eukprot:m.1321985 g.1321985  ORF g.1321985 m.1321985 type:complete len:72 (-) comp24848_c1_seq14:2575-2790(-)
MPCMSVVHRIIHSATAMSLKLAEIQVRITRHEEQIALVQLIPPSNARTVFAPDKHVSIVIVPDSTAVQVKF